MGGERDGGGAPGAICSVSEVGAGDVCDIIDVMASNVSTVDDVKATGAGMKALVAMEVLLAKTRNELRLPRVREWPRAARLEAYAAASARMAACVT